MKNEYKMEGKKMIKLTKVDRSIRNNMGYALSL